MSAEAEPLPKDQSLVSGAPRRPGPLRQAVVHPLSQLPRPVAQPVALTAHHPHPLGPGLLGEVQLGSKWVLGTTGWVGGGLVGPGQLQTTVRVLEALRVAVLGAPRWLQGPDVCLGLGWGPWWVVEGPAPHPALLLPQPHRAGLYCHPGPQREQQTLGPGIWSQGPELGYWFEEAGPNAGDGEPADALSGPAGDGGLLKDLLD